MTETPRSIADLQSLQIEKTAWPNGVSLIATVEGTTTPSSNLITQQGQLNDGDSTIRFTSQLEPPLRLKEGDTYAIADARLTCPYGVGGTRELVLTDATRVVHTTLDSTPKSVVSSLCPSCETPFTMLDYHEDGHRPEIGWQYYECSNCDTAVIPEAL